MADYESITEEWRAIPGYEGRYEVSNRGRVRRIFKPQRSRFSIKQIGGYINQGGYPEAKLRAVEGGRARTHTIHSLVAAAFIGPRPEGLEINHIDGMKTNNRPDNLEYCTRRENAQHASMMGLLPAGRWHHAVMHPERMPRGDRNGRRLHPETAPRGSGHYAAKLTEADVLAIRAAYAAGGVTYFTLAARYCVTFCNIYAIVKRKTWKHI